MLVIELKFLARRYHATPWGRNVNEGVVEWPPSSFRLARAIIDVYHRRRPLWDQERLRQILAILAHPPQYCLPEANASHIRCYLSSNDKDVFKKQKIFDPFVVMGDNTKVYAGFPGSCPQEVMDDLDELLMEMNYLGRSESWIQARVFRDADAIDFNCRPANHEGSNLLDSQVVQVACLRPEDDYLKLTTKPNKAHSKETSLSWLEAITMSTAELLAEGWSEPPGQKMVGYILPKDALKVKPKPRPGRSLSDRFSCARYALYSKVPPRVTETVPVAERVRAHLMGIHRKIMGGNPTLVSPIFSGKTPDGQPRQDHGHAVYMLLDEDHDGRLDHLVVRAGRAFDATEVEALDRLRSLWQPDGRPDIELVLVGLEAAPPQIQARTWISATPFVTTRHHRKGRGYYQDWLTQELQRECAIHGLPVPSAVTWNTGLEVQNRRLRWPEFVRSRKGRTPLQGHGCRLTFSSPIDGPFVLGALCHFGLGLFVPEW